MKYFALIAVLAMSTFGFSQSEEVKFRELQFANGMNYPQVIIPSNKAIEDSVNQSILADLKDIEESDYCIGQYGYVQKSMHLQIHIYCNCIDFDESQNRYYLYNLENGRKVPCSDIVNPQKKPETGKYLLERISAYLAESSQTVSQEESDKILKGNLDAVNVEFSRAGLLISSSTTVAWGEKPLLITWGELRPYLRINYI